MKGRRHDGSEEISVDAPTAASRGAYVIQAAARPRVRRKIARYAVADGRIVESEGDEEASVSVSRFADDSLLNKERPDGATQEPRRPRE